MIRAMFGRFGRTAVGGRDPAHRLSVVGGSGASARWLRPEGRWGRRRMRSRPGWGGTLAGGTHHALYAGKGAGFCVFNDIAIATATCSAPAGQAGGGDGPGCPSGRWDGGDLREDRKCLRSRCMARRTSRFASRRAGWILRSGWNGRRSVSGAAAEAPCRGCRVRTGDHLFQSGVDGLASDVGAIVVDGWGESRSATGWCWKLAVGRGCRWW